MSATERRTQREQEILLATRSLFDERGVRDAQIEDIARAVGINRAIIYRHFNGKEELFARTLVGYLDELDKALAHADDSGLTPPERLRGISRAFFDYGNEFPAFVDCAQTLTRRSGAELLEEVSEDVMISLGSSMGACLQHVVEILEAGNATGDFDVPDPSLLANVFYNQALGGLNLAQLKLRVSAAEPGRPVVDTVEFEPVKRYLVESAVVMARGAGATADQ